MYKLCQTEHSAKRQRAIENSLFEIMKQKPYEDISVTELCEKMNMPRKAFYRYFDSKDDTLYAFIDHSMSDYDGFSADRRSESRRSFMNEIEEYFIFWKNKRDILEALDRSGLLGVLIDRTVNYPVSDRISVSRFLPDDNESERHMIFKFAFSGLVYVMISWYKDGFNVSTRGMAKLACRMLREPLFPGLEDVGIGK